MLVDRDVAIWRVVGGELSITRHRCSPPDSSRTLSRVGPNLFGRSSRVEAANSFSVYLQVQ
ncbi:hypothetical protein KFU94_69990 [Chloroflexi bacterium TSY]|nr:hypothetical protein [Chloroflexi bacterium TSY]